MDQARNTNPTIMEAFISAQEAIAVVKAAFGAPGDYGYESREGKALFGLYQAGAVVPRSEPTNSAAPPPPSAEWAVVEILGHRRHVGRVTEIERFGAKFLRVDVPNRGDPAAHGWTTIDYAPASIFSIKATSEADAIAANTPYSYGRAYAITAAPSADEDDQDDAISEENGDGEKADDDISC